MLTRIALISMHASPLERAGQSNAGGLNVYVRELSARLAAQDLLIDIFTRRVDEETPTVITMHEGVRVIQVEAGPFEALPPDELLPFVPLFTAGIIGFARLSGHPYDLIHSHYWLSGLAALRLKRRWDVPVVQMFHTLAQVKRRVAGLWSAADQRRALLEQQVLDGVDAVVAANALEAAQLRDLYDGRRARIFAIPCGVDLDLFAPGDKAAARRTLGLPAAAPLVLAAARIEPLKDIPTAVRAVAALAGRIEPAPHLVIVGGPVTGPSGRAEIETIRQTARELGLSDRLHMVGAVTQEQLPRYMAAADVGVAPSLHESFGMVALEMLACGRPVVASAAGGLMLTVHDGENGFLAPPRDATSFAARLGDILAHDVLAKRMSIAARRSAEPYGWESVADRILCLFDSLVQANLAAAASS